MDNPTYDEAIRIDRLETITNDNTTHQRTGTNPQNPPYSEIGPKLETNTLQYQGLVQNTMAGEALYESIRNSYVLNAHTKDEEDGKVDEEMVERLYASEAVYDVPPMDDDYDDICYSIQGPTESSYSNV